MFNIFKKKEPVNTSKEQLEKITELLQNEKYDEAIEKANELITAKDKETALEAKTKMALGYFRKRSFGESFPIFSEVAKEKNDVASWFNVVTSAILSGNVEAGRIAFNKTIELQKESNYSQQPSVPQIRYYYACAMNDVKNYNEALEQLNELKTIYMQLVITDDTFVYMRGVPFMSHTLDLTKKVMAGLNIDFATSPWLKELKDAIDDDGKSLIEQYYEV